jgi:hypothetical protein
MPHLAPNIKTIPGVLGIFDIYCTDKNGRWNIIVQEKEFTAAQNSPFIKDQRMGQILPTGIK